MNASDDAVTGAQRLADRVRRRRKALRLTQEDVRRRGGPSTATQRLVESGQATELRSNTVTDLERALAWIPGSVHSIIDGGVPSEYEFDVDQESGTVGPQTHDADVLLSLPPEALEGLGPAEREEVVAAARLSALRAAREIRRRVDDEADQRR